MREPRDGLSLKRRRLQIRLREARPSESIKSSRLAQSVADNAVEGAVTRSKPDGVGATAFPQQPPLCRFAVKN